MNWVERLHSIK